MKAKLEWKGHMKDVEFQIEYYNDPGPRYYGPWLSFRLGGKYFSANGCEARALYSLRDETIALKLRGEDRNSNDLAFITNEDHRFIEQLTEIAPNIFEMFLGS